MHVRQKASESSEAFEKAMTFRTTEVGVPVLAVAHHVETEQAVVSIAAVDASHLVHERWHDSQNICSCGSGKKYKKCCGKAA